MRTFIPCHLDMALSGRSALSVRSERRADRLLFVLSNTMLISDTWTKSNILSTSLMAFLNVIKLRLRHTFLKLQLKRKFLSDFFS